jgi:diaminopimelate decarboxylase
MLDDEIMPHESREPILTWEMLNKLQHMHGDAFYLLDLNLFKKNYSRFLHSFKRHYSNTNIAYSYKTNYLPLLCRTVDRLGGMGEVVSRMEYDLAVRIGVDPKDIIFNGPYKTKADIAQAVKSGSVVNVDSWYELDLLEAISKNHVGSHMRIGIRCNIPFDEQKPSRFGFDTKTDEIAQVVERLRRIPQCTIAGFHCHALTPGRTPENYAKIAKQLIKMSKEVLESNELEFLNLGGGFFSAMPGEFEKQFPYAIPTFQQYANAIGPLFAEAFPDDTRPQLILEPGLAVVADAMQFVCRVLEKKQFGGHEFVLVSASVYNIKPTKADRNLPTKIVHRLDVHNQDVDSNSSSDIVGYTCMEDDILYRQYTGRIDQGDYVVFDNVGAYTLVLKPPFILPSPPVLSYESDPASLEIAKRQETLEDIFVTYTF